MIQITTQLRHHLFRDKISGRNQIGRPPFNDQLPPFGSYMGRRESPPPRMLHNLPPPFLNYDSVGRPHEDRPPFGPMHGPGMAPHNFERFLPPPWAPQVCKSFFLVAIGSACFYHLIWVLIACTCYLDKLSWAFIVGTTLCMPVIVDSQYDL